MSVPQPVRIYDPFQPQGATPATALPWFNVKAYGAIGDGITDDTAAFNACAAALIAAGGGVFYVPATPAGHYVPGGVTALVGSIVHIHGDGMALSKITMGAGVLFEVRPSSIQATLDHFQFDGIFITGTDAGAKTALKVSGIANVCIIKEFKFFLTGNSNDKGLQICGWDQTDIKDGLIKAAKPITVERTLYGTLAGSGSFDHFKISKVGLFSTDNVAPLITIDPGVNMSMLDIEDSAWVGGGGGIKWVNNGVLSEGGGVGFRLANVRWEQATGRFVDFNPTVRFNGIFIENSLESGSNMHGIRLRNCSNINLIGGNFGSGWGVGEQAIDVDNTCDHLSFLGFGTFNAPTVQVNIGSLLVPLRGGDPSVTSGGGYAYRDAYYAQRQANPTVDVMKVQGVSVWKNQTTIAVPLANNATFGLPLPTSAGIAIVTIVADTGAATEAGIFAITTQAGAVSIGTPTANCAVGNGAGKLGLYWDGAACYVSNKLGVAVTLVVNFN